MNIVKQLRKKAGMQQQELAELVGVARPTVSEWENNKKDPSGDRLRKLAEVFGVDELMILGISSDLANAHIMQTAFGSPIDQSLLDMLVKLTPSQLQRVEDFVSGLKAAKATQSSDLP